MKKPLIIPNNQVITDYIASYDASGNNNLTDSAILKLVNTFPTNSNKEEILLKAVAINTLYSTSILNIGKVAEAIFDMKVDEAIKDGATDIVSKIATKHGILLEKSNKPRNFYSFATKYCSFHNPNEFPIYDSFVEKILMAYQKNDPNFPPFAKADLKHYDQFKTVILNFKEYYQLSCSMKQIDKFLWLHGKEVFPPRYVKK